jgi:hypothetical protein
MVLNHAALGLWNQYRPITVCLVLPGKIWFVVEDPATTEFLVADPITICSVVLESATIWFLVVDLSTIN